MQVTDATGQHFPAHIGHEFLSDLLDGSVIILHRLEGLHPLWWDAAFDPICPPQESGVCGNGHNARNKWYMDACFPTPSNPVDEVISVVEHLCDHE